MYGGCSITGNAFVPTSESKYWRSQHSNSYLFGMGDAFTQPGQSIYLCIIKAN